MGAPFTVVNPDTGQVVYTADGLGNTFQSGTITSGDGIALTKTASPSTPSTGELKLYSPDGEGLSTVDAAGRVEIISAGPGQGGTPDWFNVKAFGATGNGTTDDTAAINAALAAANAQGGGTVYMPWGNYLISGPLSLPPYTFLRGQTEITLNLNTPPSTVSRIIASAAWAPSATAGIVEILSKTPGGWSQNTAACGLTNLFLDGSLNANTNLNGIYMQGPVYDVHLQDVFIYKAPHNGITAAGQVESGIAPTFPYHQRYARVSTVNCGNAGFNLVNYTDTTLANCLGFGNVSNNYTLQNNSNSTFTACRAEWSSGGRGFDVTGSAGSVTFAGCTTDQNFDEGLRIHAATGQSVQGGGIVWTGGKFHADGSGATNNFGVKITGSTVPVTFTGVNIESGQNVNNLSFFPAVGLEIDTSSFVTVTGCIIQGITTAYSAGSGNTDILMSNCLGATGNPNTQTYTILPNLTGGNNTAQSAPALTPTFASGVASQLTDTTRDYMVYLQIGTAGTITLAIGPTSTPANTLINAGAATGGELISFRLPAGWFVEATLTTATIATQSAIGC